jgi:hypothetical protein
MPRTASNCLGKRRYQSRIDALLVRAECMRKRPVDLRVYECRHCAGFHLTKQPLTHEVLNP